MKFSKTILVSALVLLTSSVFAQNYPDGRGNNFLPQDVDRAPSGAPSGATGPGVVYTQRTTGRIISVGAPITQSVPIGQYCQNQGNQQYNQNQGETVGSVLTTTVGALAGGALGSKFGKGNGQLAATAIGAGAAGAYAHDRYQEGQRQPQQGQNCQVQFEQQIVGYSFIAIYESIQVQGIMRRQPRIGESVEIIIRSTFYAAQ